jgi:hypothetical protein
MKYSAVEFARPVELGGRRETTWHAGADVTIEREGDWIVLRDVATGAEHETHGSNVVRGVRAPAPPKAKR